MNRVVGIWCCTCSYVLRSSTRRRVMAISSSHTEIMSFSGEKQGERTCSQSTWPVFSKSNNSLLRLALRCRFISPPLDQDWCWRCLDRMIEILLSGGTVVIPSYSTCGSIQPAAAGLASQEALIRFWLSFICMIS
jgi:hypothetical protein